jgi:hypothetical protein
MLWIPLLRSPKRKRSRKREATLALTAMRLVPAAMIAKVETMVGIAAGEEAVL